MRDLFPFLDVFRQLPTSSGIFGNDRVTFKKSQHSKDNNLMPISQKTLAGIHKVLFKGRPPTVSGRNRKLSRYKHTKYNDLQKRTAYYLCIRRRQKYKQKRVNLTIK